MGERHAGRGVEGADRGVGRALGSVAYRALRLRRRIVETQISAAFPAAESSWIDTTARGCYRHFGEELAVLARGRRAIDRALEAVRGVRGTADALERSGALDGGIVVLGHLGNWELAGGVCRRLGVRIAAVARRQGRIDRRLNAIRRGLGIEVIDRDVSARRLMRRLRDGRLLALVADQHVWRGGARLDFLGRPAWTTLGPARLALAADVPLMFSALVRDGGGYQVKTYEIERPTAAAADDAAVALTRAWLTALEREIRERPEQYFWFHRRWKARRGEGGSGNASGAQDVLGSIDGTGGGEP
ncbi:MAG: lysophospholipid acyltransferase family protein [Gemmatimonadetes bacterium]|nr:lysophospholipid acyltransferase family protein [Gemmatimonadota bacterium]